jgi:outer membrane protein assembly factor BamB
MADGRLFALPVGGGEGSPMVALDAATGRRLWRAYVTRTHGATGVAAISGALAYVVSGDGVLLAKDVDNGVNRWKAFLDDGGGLGLPVGSASVRGGRVFVTTERGSVLAYAAAGCPPALVCRPLWVWQGGASSPYESTPAVGRTTSFVGAPNRLHALDASTGRRRWSGVVEGFGEDFAVTTPVIANGVLYVTTVGNRVYAFASAGCGASTCRPLWNGVINPEVGNSTATDPPSVSHGALYVTAWVAGVTRFAVPGFP